MSRTATESEAWELRDRLRSMPQQPSVFVVPLAVMVFLRWVDFQEAEAEAMAAFDECDYQPLLPGSLHWRSWHDLPTHELPGLFTERLPAAIRNLEGSHDPLAASLVRLQPAIQSMAEIPASGLAALAGWLALQLFETPNDRRILLEHFDAFVDLAAGRETGEFRTPACINALLAALAAPKPGEHLYDPCFGFAGNLIAASRRIRREGQAGFLRTADTSLRISGMELNPNSYAVGLARLMLLGVATPQLEIGNSLERESTTNPRKHGYDLAIVNPPWGQRPQMPGVDHFPVQTNDSTALFVQHTLSQLRPEGRAIVVVPQGFLFQQGKAVSVRRWLLENHRIDAVISLPEGAFLPHTAIKAAILIIHRDGGPTRKVRMMDGKAFFEPRKGKTAGVITPERIEELAASLAAGTGDDAWDIDASMIEELGTDLSTIRREYTEFEKIVKALGEELAVHPLQQLCEISSGRAVSTSNLDAEPDFENPIPYIRIGDVQRGQTSKCTSWLNPEAVGAINPRHKLRAGDVLVSKSGTIGKIGVVRNGAIGGLASGGFFVLRPDHNQLDPHFLAAYLQSKDCQHWLKSRTSGSVISGLQKQFIESLPVPLPPLQIQHRVATDVREQEVDALTQLQSIISQRDSDPLSVWLDRALKQLDDAGPKRGTPEVMKRVFGADLRAIVFHDNRNPKSSSHLMPWVRTLHKFSDFYWNLENVPRGPSLLNILQQVESELAKAESIMMGNSLIETNAKKLNRLCLEILQEKMDDLLTEIQVIIEAKSITAITSTKAELALKLRNESPLPILNFTLKCPEWGLAVEPLYFAESETREILLEVEPPAIGESNPMRINWSGTTTAGEKIAGTVELSPKYALESLCQETSVNLGSSPYFVSEPVSQKRTDIFIGREETIERIKHQLASGNTVLLEGNRRAGKTSILKQLEGMGRIPERLAVYASLQASEGDSEVAGMRSEAVWRTLAKSIITGLATLEFDVPLPDCTTYDKKAGVGIARACRKGISAEAPWEDFLEYTTHVMHLLAEQGLGLVLMIDEFDKLQEGIDNKVTSPQIPENIRYLIQNLPGFSAILTGSRRMQRLRHEYWSALYGLGKQVSVTALEPDAARRLIQKPVEGRLTYTREAVELLIDLTARQPFLIQSLCNQVFELAAEQRTHSITAASVNEAAGRFVENNEHFASLMDYTETHRRRFIIMLVHQLSKEPDLITFGVLLNKLLNEKIEITEDELTKDVRFLQDLELIDYRGHAGGHYLLTVPLMGRWLDFQHDSHALLANARFEQDNQS